MPANGAGIGGATANWRGKWGKCSTRRIMHYSQTKCLILSFLCALSASAARAEGEIIFRIDPLGKHATSTSHMPHATC
ncbi:hypothetical protein ACLKA6_000121 [Drosophila palustris]